MDKNALCHLMDQRLAEPDAFGVVEGVMGFFDGMGMSAAASSFEIALWTKTPVILVVNARGDGIVGGSPDPGICVHGTPLRRRGTDPRCDLKPGEQGHLRILKNAIEEKTGVKVAGYFMRQEDGMLKSRHLGLVTAAEVADLDERMNVPGPRLQPRPLI